MNLNQQNLLKNEKLTDNKLNNKKAGKCATIVLPEIK